MPFSWIPWNNLARSLLKMHSLQDHCDQCIPGKYFGRILQRVIFLARTCKKGVSLKDRARIIFLNIRFFHEITFTCKIVQELY